MGVNMHPELERLERDFGWNPESIATWDQESSTWRTLAVSKHNSTFADPVSELIRNLSTNSWWYLTRNHIILNAIREFEISRTLWDVGGGTGAVSQFLVSSGYSVVGVEPSQSGARLTAQRGVQSFHSSIEELLLPTDSLHAVSLFDVLEHLDDRPKVLKEISRVLNRSGFLIITVPASRSLWSQADTEAGHYLRYNKRSIKKELESNGFEVIRMGYFFALTVLPLFVLRALPYRLGVRKAVGTEATLGASGGILGRVATWIERAIAMKTPIGSSLLVVARKR